jgi:hypothetical protein
MNLNPGKDETDFIKKSPGEYNNKHEIIGGMLGGTYWCRI